MDRRLRFELLGRLRAWLGDTEMDLGTPQQQAVLGILLLQNGGLATTDQLIGAVWGENAPRAAAGMVRSYVSRLRRALGDGVPGDVIESIAGGYALVASAVEIDVTEFHLRLEAARRLQHSGDLAAQADELRGALVLWKGMPLAGVRGEFAERERSRLLELQMSAVEDLAAADLALGRHAVARAALAPLTVEYPLRERARELLMLALYRAGRKADALGLYQDTRRLLADELGLDPGASLQDLQRRILMSDPSLMRPTFADHLAQPPVSGLSATTSGSRPYLDSDGPVAHTADDRRPSQVGAEVARQLPPTFSDFVGRTQELDKMAAMLVSKAAALPVLGIAGLAGIGKSAFAVELAQRVAAAFPDGQYFIEMGSAGEPLNGLLRMLGLDSLPESAAERSALWRSLTAGRRMLLVLDDVRDVDRVRQILPGSGGPAVLVTSRRRLFGLAHIRWTTLEPLSEVETLELLAQVAGGTRIETDLDAARELYKLTAGLPPAIRAVGARLASRPGWTVDTAVRWLAALSSSTESRGAERGALDTLYASAISDLSAAEARAVRLLALLEVPNITSALATATLGLPADQVEFLVETVADAHVIELGQDDRYYFHKPLQLYARARALLDEAEDERRGALRRASEYYAMSLRNAVGAGDRTAQPSDSAGERFDSRDAAQSWIAAERAHLSALVSQTAGLPGDWPADLARRVEEADALAS